MKAWRTAALAGGLLLLTALVYVPGLHGPFLFDDFSNLALLSEAGRLDRPENVVHYLLSGFAGPTGRPLAMASFIPEAAHWPDHPFPFKRTNLILHLLNALLLGLVTKRLLAATRRPAPALTAWLAAGIWALHPLWVSTTLYVVQRMTLLATLFCLSGILLYLVGRARLVAGRTRQGLLLIALGTYGMGLLAVLSKENGALLPLLLWVLERYGLAGAPPLSDAARRRVLVLLGLPALAVVAYLAMSLPQLFAGEAGLRGFTPGQRLLTEGRVIWNYIGELLLPRPEPGGLYAQEVPLSTGPFTPWTTAVSWLGLAAAWWVAERLRHRAPSVALAITFFLAGHVLESTWLPLELAFEHRNYLPAVFLFLPVARGIASLRPERRRATAAVLLALLGGLTAVRADLWGRPFAQALAWAHHNPDSPRAQAHLAALWLQTGNHEEAARLLDQALALRPTDLLLAANRLLTACAAGKIEEPHFARLVGAIQAAPLGHPVIRHQISQILLHLREGQCGRAGHLAFERVWTAAWQSAGDAEVRAMLLQERALMRLAEGRPAEALQDFQHALALDASPDVQLAAAAALASRGAYDEALALLDRSLPARVSPQTGIARVRDIWLAHSGYWEQERRHLRAAILADRPGALPRPRESANVAAP